MTYKKHRTPDGSKHTGTIHALRETPDGEPIYWVNGSEGHTYVYEDEIESASCSFSFNDMGPSPSIPQDEAKMLIHTRVYRLVCNVCKSFDEAEATNTDDYKAKTYAKLRNKHEAEVSW